MLKRLLITTSILALTATPALSDSHKSSETMSGEMKMEIDNSLGGSLTTDGEQYTVSDFMDMSVYSGTGEDAKMIGEVDDVVLTPEGEIAAVILEVGGFLGIGEKEVAIGYDRLTWTEKDGSRWLTTDLSEEDLENAPDFDEDVLMASVAGAAAAGAEAMENNAEQAAAEVEQETKEAAAEVEQETEQAAAEVEQETEQAAAEVERETEQAAAEVEQETEQAAAEVERETEQAAAETEQSAEQVASSMIDPNTLNAEEIIGATVYGANEENVGEIGDIILSDKNTVEAYIVNVGGFLGLGEKPVAIDAADFQISKDEYGTLSLRTPFTEEQLEEQQEYTEEAYSQDRDSVVLMKNQ